MRATGTMNNIYSKYSGNSSIDFITIYIIDAHAKDDLEKYNIEAISSINQPETIEERISLCKFYIFEWEIKMKVVVDNMKNTCSEFFAVFPARILVIKNDIIQFIGEEGPLGYSPLELDKYLISLELK